MAKTPPHPSSSAGPAAIPGAVSEAEKLAGVLNLGAFAIGALAILATASEYFSEGRSPASVALYRAYFAVGPTNHPCPAPDPGPLKKFPGVEVLRLL